MSDFRDKNETDDADFYWGMKRKQQGTYKEVQYESFTYDGVEYFLYDCVYLFNEEQPEPYIGKLIKIWESPTEGRKVLVLWFFRPLEISNYLGCENVLENELFLASGNGLGLVNENPLEAIAGKCIVVCISKDKRNQPPSLEEVKNADYVFYRTFDVGSFNISDNLGEKIASIQVKFLLNKKDFRPSDLDSNGKTDVENVAVGIQKPLFTIQDTPSNNESVGPEANRSQLLVNDGTKSDVLGKGKSEFAKDVDGPVCKVSGLKASSKAPDDNQTCRNNIAESGANVDMTGNKSLGKSKCYDSIDTLNDGKKMNHDVVTSSTDVGMTGNDASAKPKPKCCDCTNKLDEEENKNHSKKENGCVDTDKNCVEQSVQSNTSGDKRKSKFGKDCNTPVGIVQKRSPHCDVSDGSPAKKVKLDNTAIPSCENGKNNTNKSDSAPTVAEKKKLKSKGAMSKLNGNALSANVKGYNDVRVESNGHVKSSSLQPPDRSNWFKPVPWEERRKEAQNDGTLVLLQNLDPAYNSTDVEVIISRAFGMKCTVKLVQQTAKLSPYSGQAFVAFQTKRDAEQVVKKLDEWCLMLPNGRPLVGSYWLRSSDAKRSSYPGHLVIDRVRRQQREARAVSTSHTSQPNTLEYEMALEWHLLQDRAEFCWKRLYKLHEADMKMLVSRLKQRKRKGGLVQASK